MVPQSWSKVILDMLEFVRERRPGVAKVRVFNPHNDDHGYGSMHTVIQIVTDDMPFLVDSTSMAVAQADLHTARPDPSGISHRSRSGWARAEYRY